MTIILRKTKAALLLLVAVWLLTGCVKLNVDLVVNRDGSGVYGLAMGTTPELMALARDGNEDLAGDFTRPAATGLAFELNEWTDGETSWLGGEVTFDSPETLNRFIRDENQDMFETFALRRERGLLKDRFVFDARISGSGEEFNEAEMVVDPSLFVGAKMSVQLPGEVVESNGVLNVNTAGYEWTIDLDKGANIHMVSEVWNWLNIALFGTGLGALALLSLVTIGGGVIWTLRQRSSARAAPGKSLSSRAPVRNAPELFPAATELLAAIKARKYLEQTNRKLFQGQGDIAETAGAITLSWLERGARQQIVIRAVNTETVTINDQPVPATEAGVRQGLINHLKQINKIRERS